MKEINIYDYESKPTTMELPIESIDEIESIMVVVLTGDENVRIQLKNGTCIEKDASNCRRTDYIDGGYMLKSKSSIEKWINFMPKDIDDLEDNYILDVGAFSASYQRLQEFAPSQFGSYGTYERFDPEYSYNFYIEKEN